MWQIPAFLKETLVKRQIIFLSIVSKRDAGRVWFSLSHNAIP